MELAKPLIKVMSYNIHKGFSRGNKKFVLNEIKDAVKPLNPDIIFLQEVVGENRRRAKKLADWPDIPQPEFLANGTWNYFAYGQSRAHMSGHHGNAILSKFQILQWSNSALSIHPFDKRGALHTIMGIPGSSLKLHCVCVHLGLLRVARKRQLSEVIRLIKENVDDSSPLIIAGDFNDWSKKVSAELANSIGAQEIFKELRGNYARTFPSWLPALKLDRIYCRGLEPVNAEVLSGQPWKGLSDHNAICAEFRLTT